MDDSALKLENQLCFPLYAAARKVTGLYTPYLKEIGLTYTQYLVMMILWEKDGIRISDICTRLHLDTGTVTPMLKKMEETAKDGINYSGKVFITHSACFDDAKAVADAIEKRFKKLSAPVQIGYIGTVIGSHTGPGTVALFFEGQKDME